MERQHTRAVYRIHDFEIVPSELARGPWSPHAQHGGAPAGLVGHLVEEHINDPAQFIARVEVDLLRPVPIAPLTARIGGRQGKSVGRWSVELLAGDVTVLSARAISITTATLDIAATPEQALPFPDDGVPIRIPGMPDYESFHYTAMESRVGDETVTKPGPSTAWFRLACPLVNDVDPSPLVRTLAAADFGNGISWILPPDKFIFPNANLAVSLVRPARGEWIGVEAQTTIQPNGVGLASAVLHDIHGPIGTSSQTLVVSRPSAG